MITTSLLSCARLHATSPLWGNAFLPLPLAHEPHLSLSELVSWAGIHTSILSLDTLLRDPTSQEASSLVVGSCETPVQGGTWEVTGQGQLGSVAVGQSCLSFTFPKKKGQLI